MLSIILANISAFAFGFFVYSGYTHLGSAIVFVQFFLYSLLFMKGTK